MKTASRCRSTICMRALTAQQGGEGRQLAA